MRVPVITDEDGGRRPDLPEGTGYRDAEYHDDGTVTVVLLGQPEARLDALTTVARLIVADKIAAETITADDAPILAPLFDPWRPGEPVEVGALRQWDGTLVECLQAHTTQADWTPDATPALWRIYRDPEADTPAEWVQPTGAHDAYQTGDRVTFDGQVWESKIDGNVHSPAAYPAGWTLIDT